MLIISDLHLKSSEPYASSQIKLLNYLKEKYSNEILIFLGDVADSTSIHWEMFQQFALFLNSRTEATYILQGNHDRRAGRGSVIQGLSGIKNVNCIFTKTESKIEGKSCLFLPYEIYDKPIVWKGDYMFAHLTPKEESFGNEGFDSSKIECEYEFYGHIHTKSIHGRKHTCGVPIPTRNLEVCNPQILITDGVMTYVDLPHFLEIQDIDYGVDVNILNKDFLYNVINAPSKNSVYEKYKEFYIREEGIEVVCTEKEEEKIDFDKLSLKEHFKIFSNDNNLTKEIFDCGISYLDAYEHISDSR